MSPAAAGGGSWARALLKPCCRGHVDTLKLFSAACEVVKELCNTGDWCCEFHASCSSEPPSFCFSLFFNSLYQCALSVAVDIPSHFCRGQPDAGFARLCVLCVIVKSIWLQEGFLPALSTCGADTVAPLHLALTCDLHLDRTEAWIK